MKQHTQIQWIHSHCKTPISYFCSSKKLWVWSDLSSQWCFLASKAIHPLNYVAFAFTYFWYPANTFYVLIQNKWTLKKKKTKKAMCKILLIVKRILMCNLANWKDFYLLTYFCVALIQRAINNYSLTPQLEIIVTNFGGDFGQQKIYFCPKVGTILYNLQRICITLERTHCSDVLWNILQCVYYWKQKLM